MKRLTNKKGFTIIEIIVVMAVLSILVLLAMSRFTGYTQKAKEVKIKNDIILSLITLWPIIMGIQE